MRQEASAMRIARLLGLLSVTIFGGELAIMFALNYLHIGNKIVENFIDATALVVIVFPVLHFFVFKTILSAKERLEERIVERTRDIEAVNRALEQSVRKLNFHQQEMALLGEMGNFFQACRDIGEAMVVAEVQLARLFPDISGALFLMNASHNILERAVTWGRPVAMDNHHAPEECWALRRSKVHVVGETDRTLACQHMRSIEASWRMCLPLTAQGEVLGTLCLHSNAALAGAANRDANSSDDSMEFYVAAAENLALAVANLRLRETLLYQALRDPLTGLFNRRYLFDTLERELDRASARHQALSVIMFDIDHFKRFNDTFGHVAGDTVLARLGAVVREWARGEDIAVRYGGEEFTIVLPDTPAELAFARAESLRQAIETLIIDHHRQPLGRVTISVGVATYPLHADDRGALIQSADGALYSSKQNGRNRTTIAPDIESRAPAPAADGRRHVTRRKAGLALSG
jgi:diguanylate cyclase (GGDEF)-like protein